MYAGACAGRRPTRLVMISSCEYIYIYMYKLSTIYIYMYYIYKLSTICIN